MITQSYTSFLNNVHQKANIHIFVIKVNESTGQRVNESTSQRVEGPMGLVGSEGTEKAKHPLNPQIGFNGCFIFLEPYGRICGI